MKILITGGNGQLGTVLRRVLAEGQADLGPIPARLAEGTVLSTDADTLDITDRAAVLAWFERERPDLVLHAAAYTQVDACETGTACAMRINADGAKFVAEGAELVGAKMVYVSTDYVFDGTGHTPYREDDPTAPATVYGQSKRAGEEAVKAACSRAFILRTAWLYSENGGNFLKTMLRLGSTRDQVTVVNDQTGSPTYAEDLAWTMLALADTEAYGTYHVTGGGSCTWCEFAAAIMRVAGLSCRVVPCTSAEYPTAAKRPAYSVLGHGALAAQGLDRMRPWDEALTACYAKLLARAQREGGTLWEV